MKFLKNILFYLFFFFFKACKNGKLPGGDARKNPPNPKKELKKI